MTKGVKRTFKPSHDDLIRINTLAMMGLPMPRLAKHYGLTEGEFSGCMDRNPDLRKAVEDGASKGDGVLLSKVWEGIEAGNTAMIIFQSKVRLRMREQDRPGDGQPLPADKKQDKINFRGMTPIEAARVYQQIMKGDK